MCELPHITVLKLNLCIIIIFRYATYVIIVIREYNNIWINRIPVDPLLNLYAFSQRPYTRWVSRYDNIVTHTILKTWFKVLGVLKYRRRKTFPKIATVTVVISFVKISVWVVYVILCVYNLRRSFSFSYNTFF